MKPLYFGTSGRLLYGVYHPASGAAAPRGVVLVPATGQDYMRTHRGLRQLAVQLARAGVHALRFDLGGTGDSGGDADAMDIASWTSDVATAIDELKDTTGVGKVALIGIRLGGALAALAAASRTDVDEILLWDPVVNGARFADELEALYRQAPALAGHRGGPAADPEIIGVDGFPLTRRLRSEFRALDLTALPAAPARRVTLVATSLPPDLAAFRERLVAFGVAGAWRLMDSPGDWDELDRLGRILLPHEIIREIVGLVQHRPAS